ncbi:hemerythrin domain-containing protein [Halalkalibacter lacteus]|uniref:hemerythrin domain-containing protein n=1 Tax=Halalkalibacter lacteus TaxID=3090663 RepID=UPI002FC8F9A9
MENQQLHCGMIGNETSELCSPLKQLKSEHGPLRKQMEELYEYAGSIGIGKSRVTTEWKTQLLELREKVIQFTNHLEPHSEMEEGILFPLMANYIGRDIGPIAVMEYEHDQAKSNLNTFLDMTSTVKDNLTRLEAEKIAVFVSNAYLILSEHFMKEETVLFPLAEQTLSTEEKEELRERIEKSRRL